VLHLPISFTSFTEFGRRHVKMFYASICFIQYLGESSPHQPGYHSLAGLFNITIESNANLEYSWHVRSVSPWFVFLKWYMLLWLLVATGLVTYLDYFGAIFYCQTFLLCDHTKVVIHSISLSLPRSPLRQKSCLKAQIIMSSPTGTEQPHKRTFTVCSTSAPTLR
jgi:hypothetical protein